MRIEWENKLKNNSEEKMGGKSMIFVKLLESSTNVTNNKMHKPEADSD